MSLIGCPCHAVWLVEAGGFSRLAGLAGPSWVSQNGEVPPALLVARTKLNSGRQQSNYKPITPGRLAYLLTGIPTKDLHALISHCDDVERRGFPWSAIFWKEITPNTPDS